MSAASRRTVLGTALVLASVIVIATRRRTNDTNTMPTAQAEARAADST